MIKRLLYIFMIIMLGIIPLTQGNAHQKLFTQSDMQHNEQIYNALTDESDDYSDIIAAMSTEERIDFLVYIGLHDRDSLSDAQYAQIQKITMDILDDSAIALDTIFDDHQYPTIQMLSSHIRQIMLSDKYDATLKNIYTQVAGREPLEFWQSYDIFKNMLAFARKRNTLYSVDHAYEGKLKIYKINPAFDPFEQMLNEDVQTISRLLQMKDAPKVHLVYHPISKSVAWYKEKTHSISVNLAAPNITWTKLTGDILWHELYHAYQYHLIDSYIGKDITQTKTMLLQNTDTAHNIWLAAIYNANLMGYQRSHLSYALYRNQPIEDSAWNFGRNIYNEILDD
ncbi:MAG: hypothetical protein ACK5LE_08365 [Alphaproteobacteria bacterium]